MCCRELANMSVRSRADQQHTRMGEDQRLCGWLEEMALDKVVTVSVGEKRRDARHVARVQKRIIANLLTCRWRLRGAEEVEKALKILAGSQ